MSGRAVSLSCLMLALLLAAAMRAAAQQDGAEVYGPVGAPPDPKVEARWNRFYDHAAATELLRSIAEAHPHLCRLESLGRSYGGREMWLLTITDFEHGEADAKQAFWIDGGIQANEIQGVEVVLYTGWYLTEMFGRNERVGELLRERAFYLLPMLSPDSRDAHMHEPNTTHAPRSGQRPVDDDRDGLVDEDGHDDLDGDGHITQMRIRDPNGRYKPHDQFPQMMVRVEPGERGRYTLLGEEGIDNDGDGRVNEDGDGFYDPNRDWPWNWQPPYVQRGAHRYPLSIPENRMAADFIMSHPNIAGAQSYHNTAGMILRGPGVTGAREDRYRRADLAVFDAIGRKGEMILPGYRYTDVATGLYTVYGGEFDWLYQMRGITAFTNELFTPFNLFREPQQGGGWFAREEVAHRFNRYLLLGGGFVDWREVEHPQYGPIEVGGFKKNWIRQPPSFLLEEECHRNAMFTLHHADQMPLVRIRSVTASRSAGGLTRVTAVVENRRLTPTRLAVDIGRGITPPERIVLSGEGVRVVAALHADNRFFRNPREQKHHPAEVRVERIPGDGAVYVRWLVAGEGPYTVTALTTKGGGDTMTVVGPRRDEPERR